MNLIESLGLDQVESDPNALPDGKWAGEVFKSEYVWHKGKNATSDEKDHVSHVITYRVTHGDRAGAQRQEWFLIGRKDAENPEKIVPLMTEQQKPWYKKRFEDLGVPPAEINTTTPEALVGLPVNFGTKKNGNFININFVELRGDNAVAGASSDPASVIGNL